MITRTATVAAKNGLHARPAAMFAKAAEEAEVDITITHNGEEADAASLLEVMTLGVECGDEVTLSADDDSAAEALDRLVTILETEEE